MIYKEKPVYGKEYKINEDFLIAHDREEHDEIIEKWGLDENPAKVEEPAEEKPVEVKPKPQKKKSKPQKKAK